MRFTIGLPITKCEFLHETLQSINNQCFKDFEVFISNNAPTKDLKNEIRVICNSLNWHNLTYYENKEHLKIADHLNLIVKSAKGQYTVILSDDDILSENYLADFNVLITKYNHADLFHCRVALINEKNSLIKYTENCPELEEMADFIYNRLTNKRSLFLSDFVFSTRAMLEIGGFSILPYGWGIDELTWFRLSMNNVAFTNKVNLHYRVSALNFTNQRISIEKKIHDMDAYESMLRVIWLSIPTMQRQRYPTDFIHNIIICRVLEMKKGILESFVRSAGILRSISFYFKFKHILNVAVLFFLKTIIRDLLRKIRIY
jgi:glycosyltransferase involved in cell wall biosynthesis